MDKNFVINSENVAEMASKIASWIHSKVNENQRQGVVLGMSGGVDCAVVARLCQLANVDAHLILMPYGDDMVNSQSYEDAMKLINEFQFHYHIYDIQPAVDALKITDCNILAQSTEDNRLLSDINIRPRVRMSYLYQVGQLWSRAVIGTGNLVERTVGYFTKWGDGGTDFNPLGMMTKQEVYVLAEYLKVPQSIIDKKPSAGLWEGQTDEDELGILYIDLDQYVLTGTSGKPDVDIKIKAREQSSEHKRQPISLFNG